MTAALNADDRTMIDRDTRCRCIETITPPRSSAQLDQGDLPLLNEVLDAYEPAANRIANTVAVSFIDERERVIPQEQYALRELSTPVLPARERLLILPIIGVRDSERARQLTEQLLSGIRTHRAKVVVMDITGAPEVDATVANLSKIHTMGDLQGGLEEAERLLGYTVTRGVGATSS